MVSRYLGNFYVQIVPQNFIIEAFRYQKYMKFIWKCSRLPDFVCVVTKILLQSKRVLTIL